MPRFHLTFYIIHATRRYCQVKSTCGVYSIDFYVDYIAVKLIGPYFNLYPDQLDLFIEKDAFGVEFAAPGVR